MVAGLALLISALPAVAAPPAEGYSVVRRWAYVIAGTETREQAQALADRLHGEIEPGGELVWEVSPGNPFAVFGGLGGAGTPV